MALVDVYSLNINTETGRSNKESLSKYDLDSIDVSLEKNGVYQIREVSRVFD